MEICSSLSISNVQAVKVEGGTPVSCDVDLVSQRMVSCSKGGAVILWDLEKRCMVTRMSARSADDKPLSTSCVKFLHAKDTLAVATKSGLCLVFDPRSPGAPVSSFGDHRKSVSVICGSHSDSGEALYTGSEDKLVKLWVPKSGGSDEGGAYRCGSTFIGHTSGVTAMDVLSHEKVVTASEDGTVRVWNMKQGTHSIYTSKGHDTAYAVDAVVALDRRTFVSGSEDGSLALWNTNNRRAVACVKDLGTAKSISAGNDGRAETESDSDDRSPWITALGKLRGELVNTRSDVVFVGRKNAIWTYRVGHSEEGSESRHLAKRKKSTFGLWKSEQEISVKGIVNSIATSFVGSHQVGDQVSKGILVACVGIDHRRGRWLVGDKGSRNELVFADLSFAPVVVKPDSDRSAHDEGESGEQSDEGSGSEVDESDVDSRHNGRKDSRHNGRDDSRHNGKEDYRKDSRPKGRGSKRRDHSDVDEGYDSE